MILLLMPLLVKSQGIVTSGSPIKKDSVLILDSTLKQEKLYSAGLEWFAINYKSAMNVLQLQDKEAGTIIGKARMSCVIKSGKFMPLNSTNISYTLKLSFKNGKMKYELSDFIDDNYGLIKDGNVVKSTTIKIANNQYTSMKTCVLDEIALIEIKLIETFKKLNKEEW